MTRKNAFPKVKKDQVLRLGSVDSSMFLWVEVVKTDGRILKGRRLDSAQECHIDITANSVYTEGAPPSLRRYAFDPSRVERAKPAEIITYVEARRIEIANELGQKVGFAMFYADRTATLLDRQSRS